MNPPSAFRVTVEPLEEACVIRVFGEVDMSTVGRIRLALDAAREQGSTALLDLGGVDFMDSSGLHVLLDACERVDDEGWAFFVVRPSASVQRLMALTDTAARLPVVLSERAAAPPWPAERAAAAVSSGTTG